MLNTILLAKWTVNHNHLLWDKSCLSRGYIMKATYNTSVDSDIVYSHFLSVQEIGLSWVLIWWFLSKWNKHLIFGFDHPLSAAVSQLAITSSLGSLPRQMGFVLVSFSLNSLMMEEVTELWLPLNLRGLKMSARGFFSSYHFWHHNKMLSALWRVLDFLTMQTQDQPCSHCSRMHSIVTVS